MKLQGYNGKEELSRDFAKLRADLKSEGFFEPNQAHIAYRISEVGSASPSILLNCLLRQEMRPLRQSVCVFV